MADLTVHAHEEGTPVDFGRLRRDRRERALEAMERDGLDVLLLGREANVRYVSGARRLWLAGTRPFFPSCVVVRRSGAVHLLGPSDAGVPDEIPHGHLFPMSWNPANVIASVAAIDGVGEAGRIGVDGMSATVAGLMSHALPEAVLVDASPLLARARAEKLDDEVTCLRVALAATEGALETTRGALHPRVRERDLAGRFAAEAARYGLTVPALQGTFCVTPRHVDEAGGHESALPLRRLPSDRRVEAGEAVIVQAGLLYAGYEGTLARTWVCPDRSGRPDGGHGTLRERATATLDALVDACRPGSTGADLRAAYEATGEPLPPVPLAHGVGIGVEPPVVGTHLGEAFDRGWTLTAGMVLTLQAYVFSEGVGGWWESEVVHVTDGGPVRLSSGP